MMSHFNPLQFSVSWYMVHGCLVGGMYCEMGTAGRHRPRPLFVVPNATTPFITDMQCTLRHMLRRRQSIYNMVEIHGKGETRRAEQRSSNGRGGVLGKGIFPSPPTRGPGEALKASPVRPGQSSGDLAI